MQRYTVKGWDGVAVQSDDGEFVRWDDVEARDVERLAECVAKLDREAALTAERDALRARVNDEHNALALVDKLHADLAEVTRERDEARARVTELEAECAQISSEFGLPPTIRPAEGEITRMLEDARKLRARVAELSAPPVVPEGWEVASRLGRWGLLDCHGYAVDADELGVMNASIDDYIPWPALRALAWAIEHNQRPPHTGDGETP